MAHARPRVVIIGAGFAGIHCARRLKKAQVDVTLIDRSTSHVFQPLLYQCATGLLSEGAISSPIRHLTRRHRNLDVVLGEAADIDVDAREVVVDRLDLSRFRVPYDYLVVGAGMRTAYRGNDRFARFAPGMKTLDDAHVIRRKIMTAFEMAETIDDPEEQSAWLTFAVAGGGPTGVELAGQIRELATRALEREYDSIDPSRARVLLLHGGDRVLPSFDEHLSSSAQKALDKLGVETVLGVHVTGVGDDFVETTRKSDKHKEIYPARTTLWTTGVEAVPFAATLAQALGVEQDRSGRIPVTDDMSVPGHPEVFVCGDMMAYDNLPGVAEVAMQSGHHAGRVIADEVAGKANRAPFKYRDLGTAAYIARRHAVVQSGRLHIRGLPGWLAWGVIHIAFLAGARNRMGTVMNWSATLLTGSRRERAIIYGDTETARTPYGHWER
ncbi:NAD(P)/FAD-dependent oxidoreductase [Gordonia paraffinivorans]|uniref:NAD(P)/FAD-dependent oxidoreductase n=1 Tax=Gordonia paraffinivorans TaxID=175628 RepID=UPI001E5823F3|nr:NAD(P)/FAD-dependent oxidoreductase [Gordonia paraffinivorans]MCD2146186.1 NAD(P)/FAD-dependent oxidoreductase [Gordonia paraffinivorans]